MKRLLLACLALSGCQFPFGGKVGVSAVPPLVELDAHAPPGAPPPVTMRTLEGVVSVTRPTPGAGARRNYVACADFDAMGVGRDHLYWRVFCESLPDALAGGSCPAPAPCPESAPCPEPAPCTDPAAERELAELRARAANLEPAANHWLELAHECRESAGKGGPSNVVASVPLYALECPEAVRDAVRAAKGL